MASQSGLLLTEFSCGRGEEGVESKEMLKWTTTLTDSFFDRQRNAVVHGDTLMWLKNLLQRREDR